MANPSLLPLPRRSPGRGSVRARSPHRNAQRCEVGPLAGYQSRYRSRAPRPPGDPRFQQLPHFGVFVDLLAHPNARHAPAAPVGADLNRALSQVEAEVLHKGGDPAALLNEVQAEFASGVRGALGCYSRPHMCVCAAKPLPSLRVLCAIEA